MARRNRKDNCPPNPLLLKTVLEWMELFHFWDFIIALATEGKPKWKTVSKYPLSRETLCERWQNPNFLIGVRFPTGKDGKTCYVLIDIDIGSKYHPKNNPIAINELLAALEAVGLCRCIRVRSSASRGIHLYFPFSEPLPCWKVASTVKEAVERSGFEVKPGQLEIFPNCKMPKSLYSAHRLPLQLGSFVLDQDFQPEHNSIERLIQEWRLASLQQDLEEFKRTISTAQAFKRYTSGDANEWCERLEKTLERGWTGKGQTDRILQEACTYARVFLGKSWDDVESWAISTLPKIPGYQKFCNHKRDLKTRIRDWVRTNRRSGRYSPFASFPKKPKAPTNKDRSHDSLARIKAAIAQIISEQGQLPHAIRNRMQLICKIAKCSPVTLYKHRVLWHTDYETQRCVTGDSEEVTAISNRSIELTDAGKQVELTDAGKQQIQTYQMNACVTVEPIGSSAILGESFESASMSESPLDKAVTDPTLLSVYNKVKLNNPDSAIEFSDNESLQSSDFARSPRSRRQLKISENLDSRPQDAKTTNFQRAIAVNSTVRRKSDGALFSVRKINPNGTLWLRWLHQPVPLVDTIFPIFEVELIASGVAEGEEIDGHERRSNQARCQKVLRP